MIEQAAAFHSWDAMAPAALAAIATRGPFNNTAETGCGGSTIVLSQLSDCHTAFAIEGENFAITELRKRSDLKSEAVTFIEGLTKVTVPGYRFPAPLDLVLLDGPHAYPLPQIEFAYLFPQIRMGGWLVLDDLQIPSVYSLFEFLKHDDGVELEEVVVRTAFFRVKKTPSGGPDDWWLQGMNRSLVWKYSWRDRLRRILR